MGSKIRVDIQTMQYPSRHDIYVVIPLEKNLIYETFAPIDLPSSDADSFTREVICTPTAKIKLVKMKREKMAKLLADKLTHAILETMEKNDTIMGYSDE